MLGQPHFILIMFFQVLCTVSKATIVWQDGSEEKDIPTTQLYFSMSLDDHEFFPGEWVIDGDKEDSDRYGAIQHVNYLERTATVKWFKRDLNEEQLPEVICTNEMSVYDLRKHPKYEFRPGSVVKRTPTVENKIGHVIDSCPEVSRKMRKMLNLVFYFVFLMKSLQYPICVL